MPSNARNLLSLVDSSLPDAEHFSDVTFPSSEAVSLSLHDALPICAGITVTGGTLSALTWAADHTSATATFTATDGITTAGSVTVDANSYTEIGRAHV